MTIKIRNMVFLTGLIAFTVILILYTIGSVLLISYFEITTEKLFNNRLSEINLVYVFTLLLSALLSGIVIHYSFRKTSSAEIFFFMIFLLLFSVESLRLGMIYIERAFLPFETGRTLSRIIYFSRFWGTLCLFSTGLFACGVQYQRIELILGIGFLVALSLATTIPLDSSITQNSMIHTNGLEDKFFIGLLIIKILGVWNFLYAGWINNNRNYYLIALGLALATSGRELFFYGQESLITGLGLLLIISGTILFGIKTHKIYLWF